ncbi:MAG: hypothetical protein ABI370_13105 [Gammaproteobacteria bacterium]
MTKSFKFRDLKNPAEYSEFSKCYMESFRGKKLNPLQAIKTESLQSYKRIIGVYQGTHMIAGYIINQYPHRCFEYLAEEDKTKIIDSIGGANKVCEIVAIWKSKSISRLTFACKIWSAIIFDTLKERRPIVFGCSYAGHGMVKRYSILKPALVRQGKDDNDLTVFYFHRWQFLMTYFIGMAIVIPREIYRKIFQIRFVNKKITNE